MAEFYPVQLGTTLSYSGYFDFAQTVQTLRTQFGKRNYMYVEQDHNEIIREDGKEIFISVDLDRYVSDYAKLRIQLNINASKLKEALIEVDGKKIACNDGKLSLTFNTWIVTDYEGRYTGRGWLFFLQAILEKFVYERNIEKLKRLASEDTAALTKEIRSHLNLLKFTHGNS